MASCAALFDLDETLFDRRGSLRRFLADQLAAHSFRDVDQSIERWLELDNRGLAPKLGVYQIVIAEQGLQNSELAATLFRDYEENASRFARPFSGMATMFEALKKANIKTGIVTNGQTHIQQRSLTALGLENTVDTCLISEHVGLRKPDIEIFQRAADRLSIAPHQCVFVGDSPEADIVGANEAGMKTIWFPNGALWPDDLDNKADATAHSLGEVGEIILGWAE